MDWFFATLCMSFCIALRFDVNRRLQLNGLYLNFWSTLIQAIILLPITLLWPWPAWDSFFYLVAFCVGVLVMYVNTIKFNLAARYNGRVANMELPIKAYLLFAFWLSVDPGSAVKLIEEPLRGLGVLAMFVLATIAMMMIRRSNMGWKILTYLFPLALMSAILDGLSKIVLDPHVDTLVQTCLVFVMLTSAGSAVFSGIFICYKHRQQPLQDIVSFRILTGSFVVAVLTIFALVLYYIALIFAENPAYVTVVGMLTPVWLLAYHRWRKIPDEASPLMGVLMIASAIGLVLITSL